MTEKVFTRALISSVCGILLCMTCLVSTTWAWFAVGVENRDNEIQIATVTADVALHDQAGNAVEGSADGKYSVGAGTYALRIQLNNNATEAKRPVYVVMSGTCNGETQYYCFVFDGTNAEMLRTVSVENGVVQLSFSVSWVRPASYVIDGGEVVSFGKQ